jgi:hypothetical protein
VPHPIEVVLTDDLRRTRVTVLFRLILAIPHLVWLVLWSIAMVFAALAGWFATLFGGRLPDALHDFLAAYVRYTTHLYAYLSLTADPYPGFLGESGKYPVDVRIAPPERQNRWKTGFRLVLAIPALMLSSALGSGGWSGGGSEGADARTVAYSFGVVSAVAVLGWFAALATGRMPLGMRNAAALGLRYGAQVAGYLLLLTERYPDADPEHAPARDRLDHPVALGVDDDLRRTRLTVFFRLLLAIPHLIWLTLWGIAAVVAAVVMWVVALVSAHPPAGLHHFVAAYLRYATHVAAYLLLAADPYPPFDGRPEGYPVNLTIAADPEERQNRWTILFRLFLTVPAFFLASAIGAAGFLAGVLGWFAALATGRMPRQLRNLVAWALRYDGQLYAYLLLLTPRYPYSGPPA